MSGTAPGEADEEDDMYGMYEHSTRRAATGRTWLALGGGLAALLVVVALVVAACGARQDRSTAQAAASQVSPSPAVSASPEETGEQAAGSQGGSQGGGLGGAPGGSSGGESGQGSGDDSGDGGDTGDGGDDGGDGDDSDDGGDGGDGTEEEPAEPLSIEVTVDTITPGGKCSAFGTISVSGGQYPLTVHYQWRRLVLGGGLGGVPVSPVRNVTVEGPGEIAVQTLDLPEDGTNVMLNVTGPVKAYTGLVPYDGCTDGPGVIIKPGGGD